MNLSTQYSLKKKYASIPKKVSSGFSILVSRDTQQNLPSSYLLGNL